MTQVKEGQLAAAKEVRAKQQQIQMEIGALYVSKKEIEARQDELLEELRVSGDKIKEIMSELEKEYGSGSLNLETGEFTPAEVPEAEIVE
jgi:hypothetical protein|tara:strand:- start:185 stop:454 length:270 start_codon:yes stop_codon:yes gene_type:complete